MTDEKINALREKMVDAVSSFLKEKEVNAQRITTGNKKTLVKADFGFCEQTGTRHRLDVVLVDDQTLYLGMMNLIQLGPAGAVSQRVKTMVDWFEDKEEREMKDVFMLQLVANQYLQTYPTASDLLWTAVESSNSYPLSKVRRGKDGEVYVSTHLSMDGETVPDLLGEALTRLLVHTSAVVRICGLVDQYLLPETRGSVAADALLDERWNGDDDEDKDRPANEEEADEEVIL